ncbi:MAG: AAA family ATPase [Succinivibrionaceae bacterium]
MPYYSFATHHSFKDLILGDDIYIDKTSLLVDFYQNHGTFEMLIRPYGFGKTVLLDTYFYLFKYGKESKIFKNLDIQNIDCKIPKQNVVKIDFEYLPAKNNHELHKLLGNFYNNRLFEESIEESINLDDNIYNMTYNFVRILAKNSPTNKIVILIDNYESIIVKNYFDKNKEKIYFALLDFYRAIYECSSYIDWCLIFGEIKFNLSHEKHVGIPYVRDLTFDERSTSICGFTVGDMNKYYSEYIQDEADASEQSVDIFIGYLSDWYGGYRFTRHNIKVFRPESIKSFLKRVDQNDFFNFYSTQHIEDFLINVLRNTNYNPEKLLIPNSCGYNFCESSTINNIHIFSLLFQIGVFSFHHINIDIDEEIKTTTYYSCITNKEMREAYMNILKKVKDRN